MVESRAIDEKARSEYFEATFSDAVAIYLLSLTVDFDYSELREREYPLLAAPALAERLRMLRSSFLHPQATSSPSAIAAVAKNFPLRVIAAHTSVVDDRIGA